MTPMMQQYFKIKNQYKHCLLFYRLGDFYELFYDDAITASKELDLTLTGRAAGESGRAPMCGVPHHAADSYIAKLIEKGYKVAVCEQIEDPKSTKTLVNRDVIRVVTPGTVIDDKALDIGKNNYITSLYEDKNGIGIACADVSTGEFLAYGFDKKTSRLIDEITLFSPSEIITCENFNPVNIDDIKSIFNAKPQKYADWAYSYSGAYTTLCNHFKVLNLAGFGFDESLNDKRAVSAAGALFEYLHETQKISLSHIVSLKPHVKTKFMVIDAQSRRNLELTETMRDKTKKGSLLWTVDNTTTAMGARMLRKWVLQPLADISEINSRLNAVGESKDDPSFCSVVQECFKQIQDIERIMTRVIYKTANARDLAALRASIANLPRIRRLFQEKETSLFLYFGNELDILGDIFDAIDRAIVEEPPVSIRDGGMIKSGFNAELDRYKEAKDNGSQWLLSLESKEREETGIKNLKIRYNKVFGYYIEITNSNLNDVPERFVRRQTLANCERFITEELKKIEEAILSADDRLTAIEFDIFENLRQYVANNVTRIMASANILAAADSIVSLGVAAYRNNYVRPIFKNDSAITVKNGRHQVVEQFCSDTGSPFIANDINMDEAENRLLIITGPNMAGKSTYLRQTALICVMAQIGGFVPAESADLCVVDRVFTRVGASDDLATGQSTFMVEMTEVANIIHNATPKSLLILDEIGRGTSTFDGLSIAWAILEHIAYKIGAKTLFATHYHELTELEGKVPGIINYRVSVKERGKNVIFLRKIERGGADNSYGIQVARLAGVPDEITKRADGILTELSAADIAKKPIDIINNTNIEPTFKATSDKPLAIENQKGVRYGKRRLNGKGESIFINENEGQIGLES